MDYSIPGDLRGTTMLIIEAQPVVAADIEDRLCEAGVAKVDIRRSAKQNFDPHAYTAVILNGSQEQEEAQAAARKAADAGCLVVVLHDNLAVAKGLFPNSTVIEIPFDSETVLQALYRLVQKGESRQSNLPPT